MKRKKEIAIQEKGWGREKRKYGERKRCRWKWSGWKRKNQRRGQESKGQEEDVEEAGAKKKMEGREEVEEGGRRKRGSNMWKEGGRDEQI